MVIEIQKKNPLQDTPTASDREFGFVFAGFFLIVMLFPLFYGTPVRLWAGGASVAFLLTALIRPSLLQPLNWIWTKFGAVMHFIVSNIALFILYYAVATPTGLIMRLYGKDPMRLKFDSTANSYWIARTPPGPSPESLRNQF